MDQEYEVMVTATPPEVWLCRPGQFVEDDDWARLVYDPFDMVYIGSVRDVEFRVPYVFAEANRMEPGEHCHMCRNADDFWTKVAKSSGSKAKYR